MRSSVETIATYTILLIKLVRNGIHIGIVGHGLMEGGIKHAHLRQSWHQLLNCVHTLQVGWVMQGSQVRALLKHLQHLVGQDNRLIELLATMHHAVTYSVNLIEALDNTYFWVSEQRENKLHALSMLRDIVHNLLFLTIGQLNLYKGTIQSHTLSTTTGHHAFIVHVIQGVLDRGRTAIQY